MVTLAANLTMLFEEYPFFERFDRAAAAGFTAVEFFFPYGLEVDRIADALERNSLELSLFNLPLGDWDAGERGFVAQPARADDFARGLDLAVEYAEKLRPARVNTPSGPAPDTEESFLVLESNIRRAAHALADVGVGLVLEPINRIDVPGAFVSTMQRAADLVQRVAHDNFGVQYDLYHSLRAGEDPFAVIDEHLGLIRHIQVADVPGRHQPGTGKVDFGRFFSALDTAGYDGWVSLEYHPDGPTEQSFGVVRDAGLLAPDLHRAIARRDIDTKEYYP